MWNPECKNIDFPTGSRVRRASDHSCCSRQHGVVVPGPGSSYGVTVAYDNGHQHYTSTEDITKEN